jgi:hypothetical protein
LDQFPHTQDTRDIWWKCSHHLAFLQHIYIGGTFPVWGNIQPGSLWTPPACQEQIEVSSCTHYIPGSAYWDCWHEFKWTEVIVLNLMHCTGCQGIGVLSL